MSLRGRQLFVGNIPFSVGWQDLKVLFRQAGVVQRANVMLGRDGRSKGHGIVLYATMDDAKNAQEMFNGYDWNGRLLEVREDRSIVDFVPRKPAPTQEEDINNLADKLGQKLAVQEEPFEKKEDATEATGLGQSMSAEKTTDGVIEEGPDETSSAKSVQKRTIHVGNIPFRVRWQDLKDLFRKAGRIVRADVALGPENRSRGFGTVIFSTEEEAKNAITMFDQYQWQDRVIQVQEDRSGVENRRHHQEGGPGQGMGPLGPNHGGPFFRNPPPLNPNFVAGHQVYVGNLPFQCQWQELEDLFSKAGTIIRADVAHGYDGRSKGYGSVLFTTLDEARNAIAMFDGQDYNGRSLRVHYDRFAPMGPGPLMQGNMGPMMLHPHHPHHPHHHAHPHHLNAHRFGPGPGPGHGFPPNFHQAPPPPRMMSMMHGSTAPPPVPPPGGQFSMGPVPPLFRGNNFSPSQLVGGGGPGSGAEFTPSEESARNNPSSLPSADISAAGVATSASQFETQTSAGRVASSTVSSATLAPPDSVLADTSLSTAQPYPFLAQLGPIGKPGTGAPAGTMGIGAEILSISSGAGDDFEPSGGYQYQTGHHYLPYHFGNPMTNTQQINGEDGNGDDQEGQQESEGHDLNGAEFSSHDTFSLGFYMYPGFLQQHQSQQQQQQKFQQSQPQQPQQQHEQQSPLHGYSPYQEQYLPDQFLQEHQTRNGGAPGGRNNGGGVVGGLSGNGLGHGHGYPNQPEWMAPQFMMGPPHHHPHHHPHPHHQAMYGLPQFGQYGGGQYGGLMEQGGDENEDGNEGYQQQQHHQHQQQDNEYVEAPHF